MHRFSNQSRLQSALILSLSLVGIGATAALVPSSQFFTSHAQTFTSPSPDLIAREELYQPGEFIIVFKEGQTPSDIQNQVDRRAQQSESLIGKIQVTAEDASLRLKGEPKPEEIQQELERIEDRFKLDIAEESTSIPNTFALSFEEVRTAEDTAAVIDAYKDLPVEHIQPNFTYYLATTPNDPDFPKQWGHTMIQTPKLWDTHTSSGTVKIGVIDSGIDRNHPDLVQNVVSSKPIAPGCINDGDSVGHGTHVAGVIAATTNNSQGIAGVVWNAQLYGYCVVGANGQGSSLTIAEGIYQAIEDGMQVMNMSFTGPTLIGQDRAMTEAIQEALDADITIVTVAGNCGRISRGQHPDNPACYWGSDADRYMPGAHPDTISVTAIGPQFEHPDYANTGTSIDVAAPGGNPSNGSSSCKSDGSDCIYSTWDRYLTCPSTGTKSSYCSMSGTSMAAPHVTALAAMLKAMNPSAKPREILNMINSGTRDLGTADKDPIYGYGYVDAFRTITRQISPTPPASTSPSPTIPADCLEARKRGDYNCNGVVSIEDFELWRQDYLVQKATIVEFEWFRAGFTALFNTLSE